MVDWDVMNLAKQIMSVLPVQSFLGPLGGANLVVITVDAVHGERGGDQDIFMVLNYCENLNYMSSNCITYLNH